jgi:hypothetical protein
MRDLNGLPKDTRVTAPLGALLYRGIVMESQADRLLGEGMICIEPTPPVKTVPPFESIETIICPANRVTVVARAITRATGWRAIDHEKASYNRNGANVLKTS